MSHGTVHFACVERVKIAFWTFDWIFVPWGFSGGRAGTLLGIPCWGQKIILNSEYSARVYYSTGRSFSQRVFGAAHDSIFFLVFTIVIVFSEVHFAKTGFYPIFQNTITSRTPSSDGVPQRNDDDNRRRTRKNTLKQLDQSFYHFSPSNVLLVFFGKKNDYFIFPLQTTKWSKAFSFTGHTIMPEKTNFEKCS